MLESKEVAYYPVVPSYVGADSPGQTRNIVVEAQALGVMKRVKRRQTYIELTDFPVSNPGHTCLESRTPSVRRPTGSKTYSEDGSCMFSPASAFGTVCLLPYVLIGRSMRTLAYRGSMAPKRG